MHLSFLKKKKKKEWNYGNGIAEIGEFVFGNCGNAIAEIGE